MTNQMLTSIIQELGPTGLLICGLYFILNTHLKKIAHHIEIINHELGEIKTIIEYGINDKTTHTHGKN
jgi:hypothetical protein